MKPTAQTLQQIERAIRKVAAKFPPSAEPVLTDIHFQVKPESGELIAFNDDLDELDRAVIEQWLTPTEEDLYDVAASTLKQCLGRLRPEVERMSILHPFSVVLMSEDGQSLADIYLVDDDTMMLDSELLRGLSEELDAFLAELLKD